MCINISQIGTDAQLGWNRIRKGTGPARIKDQYGASTEAPAHALQALQSGEFDLSATEVEQLLAQLEVQPDGDIAYEDWIAALVDWRAVQVSFGFIRV